VAGHGHQEDGETSRRVPKTLAGFFLVETMKGTHHRKVPRDAAENVEYRKRLLERARGDRDFQRGVVQMCREDILFYINSFVWQFNPKKEPNERVGPFVTWRCQEKLLLGDPGIIWCMKHNRSAVIEKSRDMGISWLFLIFQDYLSHFFPYTQALNISRSADAVDDKSPNSLFWKIRFMHKYLPAFLRGEVTEEKMYFGYPNKSVVTGEASTGRAGVGGRSSLVFVDEFPLIKEDVEVRQRTAENADCRFFNGTHQGTGTEFYRLTQSPEFYRFVIHWTRHPLKNPGMYSYDAQQKKLRFWRYSEDMDQLVETENKYNYEPHYSFVKDGTPTGGPHPGIRSPWYDKKVREIGTARGAAMELDINPSGSVSQFFDPILIRTLTEQYACEPYWTGHLIYDDQTGRAIRLDETPAGIVKLWCPLLDGKPPRSFYGMGVDVAAGTGATPSCVSVVDGRTGEKVCEVATAHLDPKELAALVFALCEMFVDDNGIGAKVCWENQGPGVPFGKRLWEDFGYRNLYFRFNEMDMRKKSSATPGWAPNSTLTRMVLSDYSEALRTRMFLNRSHKALEETLSFRYDSRGDVENAKSRRTDDPAAARHNHADRVIADALAWKMVKDEGFAKGGVKWKNTQVVEADPCTMAYRLKMNLKEDLVWQ